MFTVNTKKCVGCGRCVKDCFATDIEMIGGKAHIKNEACIKCGHCIAICPKDAVSTDEYSMKDVLPYDKKDFEIDADTLLNFIKFRRSVRQFKDKEVSEKKILKIIEAGRFTQTARNLQEVSYTVVKDSLRVLEGLALESLKAKGEFILGDENLKDEQLKRYAASWIKMYQHFQESTDKKGGLFFNAPLVIVVSSNSDVNGSLASSNMELMADALGLGTFFSGFFVRASKGDKKIRDFLEIKEGQEIVTCMVIGYPDVKYHRTVPRKEAEVVWK